jgi:predicted outer membrane repeat protein
MNSYNIYVAKGTYYPAGIQSSTNRDSSFVILTSGVRIYGGYPSGGGTRDIVANPTVLSGEIGSSSDSTDNSYHILVSIPLSYPFSDTVIVDGLTIMGGSATGTGTKLYRTVAFPRNKGGGIFQSSGYLNVVRNCRIQNNNSSSQGGGVYVEGQFVLWMSNNTIQNNSAATSGGGATLQSTFMYVTGNSLTNNKAGRGGAIDASASAGFSLRKNLFIYNKALISAGGAVNFNAGPSINEFVLDSSEFISNTAFTGGGAFDVSGGNYFGRELGFRACVFTGNTSGIGGGALRWGPDNSLRLDTCVFTNNKTRTGGGGAILANSGNTHLIMRGSVFLLDSAIASSGGAVLAGNNVTATNCIFNANYSSNDGGAYSGISYVWGGTQSFSDCTFHRNTAGANGGAIYTASICRLTRCIIQGNTAISDGGGVCKDDFSSLDVNHSLFSGNKATKGGAIASLKGSLTMVNCTMAGDSAILGKAVYRNSATIGTIITTGTLLNCIVWEGNTNDLITSGPGSPVTANYSTLESGYTGISNTSTNPQFVAQVPVTAAPTVTGNYRLSRCSPAIDLGQTHSSYTAMTDLAGNSRLSGLGVDHGAYEFQQDTIAGVINGDTAFCPGGSTQLIATVPNGIWSTACTTGALNISSTGVVTGNSPDSCTVFYTVAGSSCNATARFKFIVHPVPPIPFINGSMNVCMGINSQAFYTSSTGNGNWHSGDSSIATITTGGFFTPLAPGTVTLSCTYADSNGCMSSDSYPVTVDTVITTTATDSFCLNGNGYVFGTQLLQTSGFYTERFTTRSGCDSVVSLSLVGISMPDTTIVPMPNGLMALDASAKYQWVKCDLNGSKINLPSDTNRIFTSAAPGDYALIVTKNGCSAMSNCFYIHVTPVGVINSLTNTCSIFPNPAQKLVSIKTGRTKAAQILIQDLTGRVLKSIQPDQIEITLDLSGWAPGNYLVIINGGDGTSCTSRLSLVNKL